LELSQRAICIISGDSTHNRKPHPEPMYLACKQAESQPQNCIYIGDALRDIQAGNNAGMKTVVANYGYIGEWENVNDWGADFTIKNPLEILSLINR
jgi:N-acetyl-D-muramate 6-phosphate phosphatase